MSCAVYHAIFHSNHQIQTYISCRSISLVGEAERKLLKEIVKQARNPVKSRVVAQETIMKFKNTLENLTDDLTDILKLENEEKEVFVDNITFV